MWFKKKKEGVLPKYKAGDWVEIKPAFMLRPNIPRQYEPSAYGSERFIIKEICFHKNRWYYKYANYLTINWLAEDDLIPVTKDFETLTIN